jgi:hypothetical protein
LIGALEFHQATLSTLVRALSLRQLAQAMRREARASTSADATMAQSGTAR